MIYSEWVCVIMCKTQVGHKSSENPYFSRVQTIKEIVQQNIRRTSKPLEIQYFQGFSYVLDSQRICMKKGQFVCVGHKYDTHRTHEKQYLVQDF